MGMIITAVTTFVLCTVCIMAVRHDKNKKILDLECKLKDIEKRKDARTTMRREMTEKVIDKCNDMDLYTKSQAELIRMLKCSIEDGGYYIVDDMIRGIVFLYEKGLVKSNPALLARAIAIIGILNRYRSPGCVNWTEVLSMYSIASAETYDKDEMKDEILEEMVKKDFSIAIRGTLFEEENKENAKAKKKITKKKK